MTDRTMRPALYLVALTALIWSYAPAQHAAAQLAISSNATIYVTPEGSSKEEKIENGSNVYISRAQCNGKWRIQLQGYSVTVPILELWTTNNQSTNCADPANRTSFNASQTICWGPKEMGNQVNGKVSFTVEGGKLFSRDAGVCEEARGNKYKIQFVTLDSKTQQGTSTVTASNNNPNQISGVFTLYTTVPDAPQNPKPSSGGRTLGIEWDKINNDPLTQYRAYFDYNPNSGALDPDAGVAMDGGALGCGSGIFDLRSVDGGTTRITGDNVPVDGINVFASAKTKGKTISIGDLDQKGIAVNSYTAVAVAAIDGAGNAGTLSEPVCVRRINTVGYLGLCQDAGTDCGDLETCSLSPRNTGSAFWLSVCTLALSALARRRRRSN